MKLEEHELASVEAHCLEYESELWGIYRRIEEEAFPERNRERHKEIFFHFLRYVLEKRSFF